MRCKKGFTLLEILIVVVIASSVLAFALPAQKRATDRNKYLAAQGVLLDIGSAVQAKRADLKMAGSTTTFPDPNEVTQVLSNATIGTEYLQDIPFNDETNAVYKNYKFYICPQDVAANDTTYCCGNNAKYIACMQDDDAANRASAGLYKGARFSRNGTMEQISL